MIKYATKEVKRIEVVKDKVICDGCYIEINEANGYFHVRTHHNDWGNDSVDSLETYDFCCPECLYEFAKPYIQDSYDGRFNTHELEIEHIKGYYGY